MTRKRIILLGASGSIGDNTLQVIRGNSDRLELVGIAARTRYRRLAKIADEFKAAHVAIYDEEAYRKARESSLFDSNVSLATGMEGLEALCTLPEADIVVSAAVGTVGLKPTLAAIEAGKDIALASKEILVLAGKFVMAAAERKGVQILPVDSEHNAIFQCLQGGRPSEVAKLILTASGGQFRDYTAEQMKTILPEDAVKHPNWSMGPKITVDSSTMANKGLEVIEAHWLFGMQPDQIQVTVHPQSIVHSMVEYVDGSIIAQLSPPSMTFAIQHILLFPERAKGVHETVDFTKMMQLDFRPPDHQRFPCLQLAYQALRTGGIAPAVFNAANEVAVAAFLKKEIPYLAIAPIIEQSLANTAHFEPDSLDAVLAADTEARQTATSLTTSDLKGVAKN